MDAGHGAGDGHSNELNGEPVLVISGHSDATTVRLTLTGELDLDGVGRLGSAIRDALRSGAVTTLEIDLQGLGFIDSAGLQAIVLGRQHTEDANATFRLVAVSPVVARIIEMTGLADTLLPSDQDADN